MRLNPPRNCKNDAAFTAQTRLNKRLRARRASRPKGGPGAIQITPRRACRIKIQSPLSAKKFSLKSTELHAFTRHGLKKLKCVLPKIRPAQAHFLNRTISQKRPPKRAHSKPPCVCACRRVLRDFPAGAGGGLTWAMRSPSPPAKFAGGGTNALGKSEYETNAIFLKGRRLRFAQINSA